MINKSVRYQSYYYFSKMPKEDKTGIFVGLNRGHVVTKPKIPAEAFKENKSRRKGRIHNRVRAVRDVVQEVCGLAPFQRKMIEMVRTGDAVKEKKAVKLARHRVGQHKRAGRIRDNLLAIIAVQKREAAERAEAEKAAKEAEKKEKKK